jgi:hypothetical protein
VPSPEQVRRLIACLCVAAILLAAAGLGSWGLLFAVLVPTISIVVADSSAHLRRTGRDPHPQYPGFLSLSLSRAPPVV